GATFIASDGYVDPASLCQALASGARALGVRFVQGCEVTGFGIENRRVISVETDQGEIRCEIIINAAGMWAPCIAAMAGLHIPTTPVDHQHIALHAVSGHEFDARTPCLRDPDNLVYMRQEQGGLVIGNVNALAMEPLGHVAGEGAGRVEAGRA
ncbi:MAG TPA: FAD-dependent oxidoreductase, partial [Anaerolineales bacterium]|nr:FAD-dependent oxidoreductase [Anaerolineales bacterium]